MQFNVALLLREHVGSTREYTLEAEPPNGQGQLRLMRTGEGVLASLRADVWLEAECSRCLAPFGYRTTIVFDELFYQQVDLATGAPLELPDEPEAFRIGRDHDIDIREAVRQYSDMAAAMQPLCRPDCPGLCPVCGKDQSLETCDCERTPADARWGALAALQQRADA